MNEDQKVKRGTVHFAKPGRMKTTRKPTRHDFPKKVFDNAVDEAERLGISVSEYLSRITDATHDLK